ncbi:uncharacterized protein LOC142323464 [Lycorma delicatula]|uniref:uncharacterized protein LOC142323464 n=1 Tax=Lycorma delicatula TaxID=130591 RepID=UPI003F511967
MSTQPSDPTNHDQERSEETVDPRVQIELERLNAATDDINKLEVDLDDARAGFRQLLCESTLRIDALARKLGACVERARPYYEARIKAKEALHETQLAAIRFERANSAHAAAKEMVYLAEEGLCTEGRTFDHAWQEMLNHATMRVNESELERTLSEAEHRRTSQSYQRAEIRVQQLQKELKRSIAKSSKNTRYALLAFNQSAAAVYLNNLPYFELKAQFNQVLEEQKIKVKELEKRVGAAKASYAEALSNLEQISDEIHRIRKFETEKESKSNGRPIGGITETVFPSANTLSTATTLSSSTDHWSDSETTGSPDSESEDHYLQLPDKVGPTASPIIPKKSHDDKSIPSEFLTLKDKTSIKNSNVQTEVYNRTCRSQSTEGDLNLDTHASGSRLLSNVLPYGLEQEEENMIQSLFSKIVPAKLRQNSVDHVSLKMISETSDKTDQSNLGYHTSSSHYVSELFTLCDENSKREENSGKDGAETWSEVSLTISNKTTPESEKQSDKQGEIWTEVNLNDSSSQSTDTGDPPGGSENSNTTPIRLKLDSSLSNWITRSSVDQSSGTNGSRRQSLDTLIMGSLATGERVKEILSQGIMKLNISSLTERRSSEPRTDKPSLSISQTNVVSAGKKVPSPLEKSILYLNPEEDSASDSESLASVEMLNDDQISSLMLDNEIQEACQQVLGTPLSEVAYIQR